MNLTAQRNLAVAIHPVQLKNVLCQIDPMVAIFMAGAPIPQ